MAQREADSGESILALIGPAIRGIITRAARALRRRTRQEVRVEWRKGMWGEAIILEGTQATILPLEGVAIQTLMHTIVHGQTFPGGIHLEVPHTDGTVKVPGWAVQPLADAVLERYSKLLANAEETHPGVGA